MTDDEKLEQLETLAKEIEDTFETLTDKTVAKHFMENLEGFAYYNLEEIQSE